MNKIKLIFFTLLLCGVTTQAFMLPDSLITIQLKDSVKINELLLSCFRGKVNLIDSEKLVIRKYDIAEGQILSIVNNEYYNFFYGQLYSRNIYSDGKLKEYRHHYYDADSSSYLFFLYDDSGNVQATGKTKKGLQEGIFKEYYPNGDLKIKSHYSRGMKNGSYKENFPNGKLKIIGNYKKDLKNGKWVSYDEEGMQTMDESYLNNAAVSSEEQKNKIRQEKYFSSLLKRYNLKCIDFKGCILITKNSGKDTVAFLHAGDRVSINSAECNTYDGYLKAIKYGYVYVARKNSDQKEIDLCRVKTSAIDEIGYLEPDSAQASIGKSIFPRNFKMILVCDEEYKFEFVDGCEK